MIDRSIDRLNDRPIDRSTDVTHDDRDDERRSRETTTRETIIMSARSALLRLGRTTAFAPMCATTTMTAIGARAYSTGASTSSRVEDDPSG